MARKSITITVTAAPRWWLKAYLCGVLLAVQVTGREPNWQRVRYWIGKGRQDGVSLMVARPKTICRKGGCGALIDAPGYCDKHAPLKSGWNRSHGTKNSTERGYDYAWQQLRKRILRRDKGLCQIKGPTCRYVAREVDHKVSKASAREQGWSDAEIDDESNLQSACSPCHAAKTKAERGGGS